MSVAGDKYTRGRTHRQPIEHRNDVPRDVCTRRETERREKTVMDSWRSRAVGSFVLKLLLLSEWEKKKKKERKKKKKKKTALVSHLGQTVFVSNFGCLFECSSRAHQMEFTASRTDKSIQMSFHDVRYRLSVTEGLNVSGFLVQMGHEGWQIWTQVNLMYFTHDKTLPGSLWVIQQALMNYNHRLLQVWLPSHPKTTRVMWRWI